MYHPTYAWMFFNWYLDNWWLANSSCILDGSVNRESLERVVRNSIIFDHYPRLEDEQRDKVNKANIVSLISCMDMLKLLLIKIGGSELKGQEDTCKLVIYI